MGRLTNQRILVTGGTGFVGSHVVEALVQLGAQVVVPYRTINPYSYFSYQALQEKVLMVGCDINDAQRVFDIVNRYEIKTIFHLAAQPIVTTAYHNPQETLQTNIMGTVNILEAARRLERVTGVIVASSDKAYGKTDQIYVENHPLHGDHPYEVSKSAADLIAQTYFKTYGLPVVITRFGNIYGEGDLNQSRIIPGIMLALAKSEPLILRSNGQYERAYLYVKDVVSGYLTIAEILNDVVGQAFNFGTDEVYSVIDLIRQVEKLLGKEVRYFIEGTAINEIPSQKLDWTKSQQLLGWQPRHPLGLVVEQIFQWYQKVNVGENILANTPINQSKKVTTHLPVASTIFSNS